MSQLTDEQIHEIFWSWLDEQTKILAEAEREEAPQIFLDIMSNILSIGGMNYSDALDLVVHGLFHAGLSLKTAMLLIDMVFFDREDLLDKLIMAYNPHDEDELASSSDEASENYFTLSDHDDEMIDDWAVFYEDDEMEDTVDDSWVATIYFVDDEDDEDEEEIFWEAYNNYAPKDFDLFDGKRTPKFTKHHPKPERFFTQHEQNHLLHRRDKKVRQQGRRCQPILPNDSQLWEDITTTTPFLSMMYLHREKEVKNVKLPLDRRQQLKLESLYGIQIGSKYSWLYSPVMDNKFCFHSWYCSCRYY